MGYKIETDDITIAEMLNQMGYGYDPNNPEHNDVVTFLDEFMIPAFCDAFDRWREHKVRVAAGKAKRATKGKTCRICGGKAECCHHILLVALGGDNSDENIAYLCKKCHKRVHQAKAYGHEAFETFATNTISGRNDNE